MENVWCSIHHGGTKLKSSVMADAGHWAYTGCAVRLTSRKRFPDVRVKSEKFHGAVAQG